MSNVHGFIPPIDWHGSRFTGGLLANMGTPEQDGQIYITSDVLTEIYVGLIAGNPASWLKIYPIPASIAVRDVDGTPLVAAVNTIMVTNGKLTDNGAGVVTLDLTGTTIPPIPDTIFDLSDVGGDLTPATNTVLTWSGAEAEFLAPASGGSLQASRVSKTGTDTVTSGAGETAIGWPTEDFDAMGGFNLGVDSTIFTAPATGIYQHIVHINGTMTVDDNRVDLRFEVNGTIRTYTYAWNPTNNNIVTLMTNHIVQMTSGHTAKTKIWVSGGNIDITGGECFWQVVRLS